MYQLVPIVGLSPVGEYMFVAFYVHHLEFPLAEDAFCKVWMKLVMCLRRRSQKYEKFTERQDGWQEIGQSWSENLIHAFTMNEL